MSEQTRMPMDLKVHRLTLSNAAVMIAVSWPALIARASGLEVADPLPPL